MKKIYFILLIISGTMLESCTSENEGIFLGLFVDQSFSGGDEYEVNMYVYNEGLVNTLQNAYDGEPWFDNNSLTGNDMVRTNILVYNENGTLVDIQTHYYQSFTQPVVQSSFLAEGTYTVLTVVDIVTNQTDTYWKLVDYSQLNTAKVQFANYTPQYYGLLAYDAKVIDVVNSQTVYIYPEHVGAYVTLHFTNLDYINNRYVYFKYDIDPDTYLFKSNTYSFLLNYYSESTLDFENIYSGYYTNFYMLPKSSMQLQYYIKNNFGNISSTTRYVYITASSGNHKRIEINTSNQTYTTYSMAPGVDSQQSVSILPVNQVNEKNQDVSIKLKDFKPIR